MSKTVNLGACTAYGIARKYGYTGTEEEWNALQNSLKNEAATYANSARSSASAALTSEQKAAASEANAKAYMDSAEESKNAAFSTTPEGYEANVQKLEDMDIQTATGESLSLVDTRTGGIKIDKIAGKSVQNQYIGKNLYDELNLNKSYAYNGITCTVQSDGSLKISGTATAAVNMVMDKFALKAGTYTFSSETHTKADVCLYSNTDAAFIVNNSGTFTLTKDTVADLRVQVGSGSSVNCTFHIQIEAGDTATDYEPYVGGTPAPNPDYPQEIESVGDGGSVKVTSCGKNLINATLGTVTQNGVTCTANGDGTYTLNGTVEDITSLNIVKNYVIKKGTYKLIGCPQGGGKSSYKIGLCKFNPYAYINFDDFGSGLSKTIDEDIIATIDIILYKDTVLKDVLFKPMLTADLEATYDDYEPYQSTEITIPLSEPLRSIGDVKDEIVKQDGMWGVLRRIGKVVLDGSETYWESGKGVNCNAICALVKPTRNNSEIPNVICDCLKIDSSDNIFGGKCSYNAAISVNATGNINLYNIDIENASDMKVWITSNPVTLVYELTTPTFTPFDDQTPFYGLSSFETATTIITDQTIEPTLEIEYGKSQVSAYTLENYNVSKKNEVIISALQEAAASSETSTT